MGLAPLSGGCDRGRGSHTWRDPPGLSGFGGVRLVFPPPSRPWEACWAPAQGPPPSEAPSSLLGPRGIGGRERGKEEEKWKGRGPLGLEDQGRRD